MKGECPILPGTSYRSIFGLFPAGSAAALGLKRGGFRTGYPRYPQGTEAGSENPRTNLLSVCYNPNAWIVMTPAGL